MKFSDSDIAIAQWKVLKSRFYRVKAIVIATSLKKIGSAPIFSVYAKNWTSLTHPGEQLQNGLAQIKFNSPYFPHILKLIVYQKGDLVKQPMKSRDVLPKNVPGVGWGVSCRGGVGYVMQGWGGSYRDGVVYVMQGWGGLWHAGVGWVT